MKFYETAVLLLAAANAPVPGSGQPRMRTNTRPNRNDEVMNRIQNEEDAPFWASAILANIGSMISPTPTRSPTPAPQGSSVHPSSSVTNVPTTTPISLKITDIDNSDVLFTEIFNVASYTTFCQTGEYTNVQIVGAIDETVYCITNFEGAEVEFGYEQDFPDRPIIKLEIEPPITCGDDNDHELEDSSDIPYRNYCGFFGKSNFQPMSNTVTTLNEDSGGVIDANITAIASYTTYCVEDEYSNVEIVDFGGDVLCIKVSPGNPTIDLVDNSGFVVSIDVEPTLTCDGIAGSRSVACGFDGVSVTVYPNFDNDGNSTDSNSTDF